MIASTISQAAARSNATASRAEPADIGSTAADIEQPAWKATPRQAREDEGGV
jgi:hypothetical protein